MIAIMVLFFLLGWVVGCCQWAELFGVSGLTWGARFSVERITGFSRTTDFSPRSDPGAAVGGFFFDGYPRVRRS